MVDESTVVGWLTEQGIDYQEAKELADPAEYKWAGTFRQEGRFQVLLAQRDVEWIDVVMQVSINVADEHREMLRGLDSDMRDRFYHDLRIALLQLPVGYNLNFLEDEPYVMSNFVLGTRLFEENLTRAGFFRRHHQTQSAALLVVEMFRKLARFKEW